MRARREQSGAALLMALAAVVIVSALGVSMTTIVLCSMRSDRESSARDELLNASESGVEYAIWKLGKDANWPGQEGVPIPGGECVISIGELPGGAREITSRARRGERTRVVRVTVKIAPSREFRIVDWTLLP